MGKGPEQQPQSGNEPSSKLPLRGVVRVPGNYTIIGTEPLTSPSETGPNDTSMGTLLRVKGRRDPKTSIQHSDPKYQPALFDAYLVTVRLDIDPENPEVLKVVEKEELLKSSIRGYASTALDEGKKVLQEREELEAQLKMSSPETRLTPSQAELELINAERQRTRDLEKAKKQRELDAIKIDTEIEHTQPKPETKPTIGEIHGKIVGVKTLPGFDETVFTYIKASARLDEPSRHPLDKKAENDKKTLEYKLAVVTVTSIVGDDGEIDFVEEKVPLFKGTFAGALDALTKASEIYDQRNKDIALFRKEIDAVGEADMQALEQQVVEKMEEEVAEEMAQIALFRKEIDAVGEIDMQAVEKQVAEKEKVDEQMRRFASVILENQKMPVTDENIQAVLAEHGDQMAAEIQNTQANFDQTIINKTNMYLSGISNPTDKEKEEAKERATNEWMEIARRIIGNNELTDPTAIGAEFNIAQRQDQKGVTQRHRAELEKQRQADLERQIVEQMWANSGNAYSKERDSETERSDTRAHIENFVRYLLKVQGYDDPSEEQINRLKENLRLNSQGPQIETDASTEAKDKPEAIDPEELEKQKFAERVERLKETYREVNGELPEDENHIAEQLRDFQEQWKNEIQATTDLLLRHPAFGGNEEKARASAEKMVFKRMHNLTNKDITDPKEMGVEYYMTFIRDRHELAERIQQYEQQEEEAVRDAEEEPWGSYFDEESEIGEGIYLNGGSDLSTVIEFPSGIGQEGMFNQPVQESKGVDDPGIDDIDR